MILYTDRSGIEVPSVSAGKDVWRGRKQIAVLFPAAHSGRVDTILT